MSGDILILGRSGQVGRALVWLLNERALAPERSAVDLGDADFIKKLESWLAGRPVSAVINAAAYTAVDKAEDGERAEALRVNGAAVSELAAWCKARKLPLVHYSTDYVFDGSGSAPRREDEPTAPVNSYGASKLIGERAIQEA
ncbi:MAG: sugar nucleotide-binding protein, partial [Pseudomonadota bacterium]|nr:sugar nucleotide-binding protein [Pseudomonadota bacterium]